MFRAVTTGDTLELHDDDANSADPITEEQALDIRTMLDYLSPTPTWYAKWWAWIGQDEHKVEAIQATNYKRVHDDLVRRVREQEAKRGGQ